MNPARKVMVVDDSTTIRRTAQAILQEEGFEVATAEDGFEALARLIDVKPDIIFMDIGMPRLDGYQACSVIKNSRLFRKTPVIMLSSKDGLFDIARGRLMGAEQFMTKPFTREDLLEVVNRYAHPI
ncbi:MAG: response regulator [Gammaproteobacteria bacterium]|nr:response regulator [Gammaproteobacteria bacterium]MCP5458051.1 response regulator [Gammaproteobacteria bacterium]